MKSFNDFERQVDKEIAALGILNVPARALLCFFHYTIFSISNAKALKLEPDPRAGFAIAMRMNKILPLLENMDVEPFCSSVENALTEFIKTDPDGYQFRTLLTYTHYSDLMPEYHRKYYVVVETEEGFVLSHPDDEFSTIQAKDILLSELAIPFRTDKPKLPRKEVFALAKSAPKVDIQMLISELKIESTLFLKNIYEPQLISDEGLKNIIGIGNKEFNSLRATILGFMSLYSNIAKILWIWAEKGNLFATSSEGLEWLSGNIKYDFFCNIISKVSEIPEDKVDKVLRLFSIDFSETPLHHYGGDGFFPPFSIFKEGIIFNPNTVMMFMQVRNLIYAHMKKSPKSFNELVSRYLEPTLIEQAKKLLTTKKNWIVKTNINYSIEDISGELDLVILDVTSGHLAIIEAKAPLAPHGARTTQRLAERIEEGISQLDKFKNLDENFKEGLIRKEFEVDFDVKSYSYNLLARSCFGSVEAWKRAPEIRLITLSLLSAGLHFSLNENDLEKYLDNCLSAFDDIFSNSKPEWELASIEISEKKITFPNLVYDESYLEGRRAIINLPPVID